MSEDRYQFIFSDQNSKNNLKKHQKVIAKCFQKAGLEPREIDGGRDRKTLDYTITVWPTAGDAMEAVKQALAYLHKVPAESRPYAAWLSDKTNGDYHYVLEDGEIYGIDSGDRLTFVLEGGKPSPEKRFYDAVQGSNNFLLRLSFSKKSDIAGLSRTSAALVNSNSETTREHFISAVNEMLARAGFSDHQFPKGRARNIPGDIAFLNYLTFSEIDGKELYLGFTFPAQTALQAKPKDQCVYSDVIYQNTNCKETLNFLALIECLYLANSRKGIAGKYQAAIDTDPSCAYVYSYDDVFTFGPCEPFPSQIWPG